MAEISADRQQKLLEEYEQLKEKILEIDHKYSLSYHEVKLDMPESLGLQKLTFTPHTEEELQQLALQEVKPKYDEKLRVLQKSTDTSKNTVLYNISVQEEKNRQQLSQLEEQLSDDKKSLSDKLAYNGLWYSTVKQQAENSLQQDYLASVEEQNTRHEAQIAALEEKITQLDSVYSEGAASIQEQLQTALAAEIEVFRERTKNNASPWKSTTTRWTKRKTNTRQVAHVRCSTPFRQSTSVLSKRRKSMPNLAKQACSNK